jgi:hypothetical protein
MGSSLARRRITMYRRPLLALAAVLLTAGGLRADPLPENARKLIEQHAKDVEEIRKQADLAVEQRNRQLIDALQQLATDLAKAGRGADVAAVKTQIALLKGGAAKPDPGSLVTYANKVGQSFLFEVTGAGSGVVWGSGPYTTDSALAAAAVHAGVLKVGEKGVVKVTILPGEASYPGSKRNGITSNSWARFDSSFKVEKAP